MMRRRFTLLAAAGALVLACGGQPASPDADASLVDSSVAVDAGRTFLDDPSGELPALLSEVGLYPALPDRSVVDARATSYVPRYPLWSNGSQKERFIVVPPGAAVDIGDRDAWLFSPGTLLFKTFSYVEPESMEPVPVETRIIRRRDDGWDFVAYRWREDGTDAERLAGTAATDVTVHDAEQGTFQHSIPSRLECRVCHESRPATILGFSELQLGDVLEDLAARGVLAGDAPDQPDEVVHEDPATRDVLAYFEGNCTHCHNGGTGPNNSFDLRHPVALENTIDQPTEGIGSANGLRIDPGSPSTSVLFLAFSGETEDPELRLMPPAGVQRRDASTIESLRQWILSLPSSP